MSRLALVLALVGCTHQTSIRHAGEEIGEEGTATFANGEERDVRLTGFVQGGVVVHDGFQQWQVPYPSLRKIEYTSHSGGAWQGVKYGTLIGALLGVVWGIGLSSETDDDEVFGEPGEAVLAGAFIFGFTGLVFGAPIGAIKGKTTVYEVDVR